VKNTIRSVAIIPSAFKAGTVAMGEEIAVWLSERSVTPVFGRNALADFAVVIGGDGSIMREAKEVRPVPVIAINFGTLGFLAAAKKDNWRDVLTKVLEGRYALKKHRLLSAVHYSGRRVTEKSCCCFENRLDAIGDIYIRHKARMIVFTVVADGEVIFDHIRGDGVIVATPLGSTAYNLSAGGPIITKGVVITPICPHPVRQESEQLKNFDEIRIIYHGVKGEKDEGCLMFVDGDDYPIRPGHEIAITKSSEFASLVIHEGFSFADARRRKLGGAGCR
jgi:NAD+ kinase